MGSTLNSQPPSPHPSHPPHQQPTMTRVWTYSSQKDANQKYKALIMHMHLQHPFEMQIKWVHKEDLKQSRTWKVITAFQYPHQSLRKALGNRKEARLFFIVQQIFHMFQLMAYCLCHYRQYICSHTDLLAHIFILKQNHQIKLCNPHLLYSPCKIQHCLPTINHQKHLQQIFQLLLLQKISRVTPKHLQKVNLLYLNAQLNHLISIISNPSTNIETFLLSSHFMREMTAKNQEKMLEIDSENSYEGNPNLFPAKQIKKSSFWKSYHLPKKLSEMNNQFAYSIVQQNQIDVSYEQQTNQQEIYQLNMQKYPNQLIKKDSSSNLKIDKIKENEEEEYDVCLQDDSQQAIINQSLLETHSNRNQSEKEDSMVWVVQFYNNGRNRYEGCMRGGKKEGRGKYYYDDGVFYDGQWKEDEINGFGKLHYDNEQIAYEGFWQNGLFNGEGILRNKYVQQIEGSFDYKDFSDVGLKWKQFEGVFKDDEKNGKGTLLLSNDQKFKCRWVSNVAQGYGQFCSIEGDLIIGLWSNNIFCQSLKLSCCSSGIQ